jgi:hypothetical protein
MGIWLRHSCWRLRVQALWPLNIGRASILDRKHSLKLELARKHLGPPSNPGTPNRFLEADVGCGRQRAAANPQILFLLYGLFSGVACTRFG